MRKLRLTAIALIVGAGVVFLILDWRAGQLAVLVVGLLNFGRDIWSFLRRLWVPTKLILEPDEALSAKISQLVLTSGYREAGYAVTKLPVATDEYIARSPKVDSHVRNQEIAVVEDHAALMRINGMIQGQSEQMELALRCQYRTSWGSNPPRKFVNEAKTCLGQDLIGSEHTVRVFQGSYFHSFLTNELVQYVLEPDIGRPSSTFTGSKHFPASAVNDTWQLKGITDSGMCNHIGISTIVHTRDGKLAIWRQNRRAQQSHGLLVPTGSGSCDWSDWRGLAGKNTFQALLAAAMEREFREESHPKKRHLGDVRIQTAVLGYFRWIRRGGNPDFVGISKADVFSDHLEPNPEEVDAPDGEHLSLYDAATIAQLREAITTLLKRQDLSVPLFVGLSCLVEALDEDCERWTEFLGIAPT